MDDAESRLAAITQAYYFWDIVTLVCGMTGVFGFLAIIAFMLGLPGRIAESRDHPEAEAVYTMGWTGFMAIVPWIQAFIWAFKPTDVVDIRRFPKEEQEAIKRDLARFRARAYGRVPDPEQDAPPAGAQPAPPLDRES